MEYENIYFHQSFTTSICEKIEKGLKTRGRLFIYYFRTHRSSDHIVVKIHFCPIEACYPREKRSVLEERDILPTY